MPTTPVKKTTVSKKAVSVNEEDAVEMFEFECEDGTTITMPSLADLDPDLDALDDVGDGLQSENPLISMRANRRFLIASLPGDQGQQVRRIKRASEFMVFLTAWSKFSGVTPGELRASSDS